MTKEELKQEAEDYARKWLFHVKDLELYHKEDNKPEYIRIKEAYLAGAEPREKQIQEKDNEIADLKKRARDLVHCIEHCAKNEWAIIRCVQRLKELI